MEPVLSIEMMPPEGIDRHLHELAKLLHTVVHDGASIGFVLPFSEAEAERFWADKVRSEVAANARLLFVARERDRIAGSVQLFHGTPANQPHRVEVNKLMVHPDFRRRGIAKSLMTVLEREARFLGRSLITLDTRTGDTAEPLYTVLGYTTAGVIPNFCRDTMDAGRLDPTTIMYKEI